MWWSKLLAHEERQEPVELTLYSRPSCHLCDEMKLEIARAGLSQRYKLVEVNIESDPRLEEQYGQSIPVLSIDGRPAFKGRWTGAELRRKLDRRLGR